MLFCKKLFFSSALAILSFALVSAPNFAIATTSCSKPPSCAFNEMLYWNENPLPAGTPPRFECRVFAPAAACAAGHFASWDSQKIQCIPGPSSAPAVPNCPPGEVLTSNGSGGYQCTNPMPGCTGPSKMAYLVDQTATCTNMACSDHVFGIAVCGAPTCPPGANLYAQPQYHPSGGDNKNFFRVFCQNL